MESPDRRHAALFENAVAPVDPVELLRGMAENTCEHARNLLDTDGATVTAVDGPDIVYISGAGLGEKLVGRRVPLGDSHTGRVVLDRKARFFRFSPNITEASKERAKRDQINSGIICPIVGENDRVYGTVGVASLRESAYDDEDVEKLSRLARFVASRLDRDLVRAVHERDRSWARLRRIGACLSARQLTPLIAAREALAEAAETASDDAIDDIRRALDAVEDTLTTFAEVRLGHVDDQASSEPRRRPTSTPLGMRAVTPGGALVDPTTEVQTAAAFLRHELAGLADVQTDIESIVESTVAPLRESAPRGTLAELLIQLTYAVADQLPTDERSENTLTITATESDASLTLSARASRRALSERADLDVDPLSVAGAEAGTPGALARRAAEHLDAELRFGDAVAEATIPLETD